MDGSGMTAQLLMENGLRCIDVGDVIEISEGVIIRKMFAGEVNLLKVFLYEAIFIARQDFEIQVR